MQGCAKPPHGGGKQPVCKQLEEMIVRMKSQVLQLKAKGGIRRRSRGVAVVGV